MIKILFLFFLSNYSYADEKINQHFAKLATCTSDRLVMTPEYIANRSSIDYTQTIKGFKDNFCLVDIDLWVFLQECKIPKDKLVEFKNYSPKNKKLKANYDSIFRENCQFGRDSISEAAVNGIVSSLIAPLIHNAKNCDEGNKEACTKYKSNLLKLNNDCKKNNPTEAVCKKIKTAGFK